MGLTEGGIANLLDRMSEACRFTIPPQLPPTSPETLIYRIGASPPPTCLRRTCGSGGTNNWTSLVVWIRAPALPGAMEGARVSSPDQPFGNSKYGFLFLLRKDKPMACLAKTSMC